MLVLKEPHPNQYQIFFEINIKGDLKSDFDINTDCKIRECIVLSLLLSQKEHFKFHYDFSQNQFEQMPDNSYITLPYAFLNFRLDDTYINSYYQADYMKMQLGGHGYYTLFPESQQNEMSVILSKVLKNDYLLFKKPVIDMFIHSLTLPWNKTGTFYPSVVSIFSCFESILNKKNHQQIKDLMATEFNCIDSPPLEYDVLKELQTFRNGIAHLESYNIDCDGIIYRCIKLSDGSLKAEFGIDKLDQSRKLLTELIIKKIT